MIFLLQFKLREVGYDLNDILILFIYLCMINGTGHNHNALYVSEKKKKDFFLQRFYFWRKCIKNIIEIPFI